MGGIDQLLCPPDLVFEIIEQWAQSESWLIVLVYSEHERKVAISQLSHFVWLDYCLLHLFALGVLG